MTRKKQINKAAEQFLADRPKGYFHTKAEENTAHTGFIMGAKWADEYPKNPWRDASMEKPPYDTDCDDETSVYVIVRQEQGNVLEAYYDYDNNDWRDREHNWRLQDPTHWMPIPQIKKGE